MKITLEEAKERLKIPELAREVGLPVEIPEQDGKTVTCWFPENHPRGDQHPSFNLHDGLKRGKCFSCGVTFDGPGLISLTKGISNKDAVREFMRQRNVQIRSVSSNAGTPSPLKSKSVMTAIFSGL